jgi:uncharacterized protein (TIGR02118 family)
MIKRISLLARKEGMTREQFTRHWLDVHAPLAHAVPGLRRYVQSHIIEEFHRPDIPAASVEVDGIAELWFADRAAMQRALASPEMQALHADGALFIGRIATFVVEEKVIIPRAPTPAAPAPSAPRPRKAPARRGRRSGPGGPRARRG